MDVLVTTLASVWVTGQSVRTTVMIKIPTIIIIIVPRLRSCELEFPEHGIRAVVVLEVIYDDRIHLRVAYRWSRSLRPRTDFVNTPDTS